jgi:hypothetical protein
MGGDVPTGWTKKELLNIEGRGGGDQWKKVAYTREKG